MKNEYIIVNKTTIQKRIEELENVIEEKKIGVENERWLKHELKQILSQSTPLIPEIEKAFEQGRVSAEVDSKEQRAKLLTEIMEADQKNGLYDNHIGDTNKMVTAVESFAKELIDEGFYIPKGIYDRAKQMEKEQIIYAHLTGLIHPLETEATKQAEQYYNETYKNK